MAFGKKDCVYEGFSCGEEPAVHSTSYMPTQHVSGLITQDGERTREGNSAIGTRVAFTITASGDTHGVKGDIQKILVKHRIDHKVKDWEKATPDAQVKTITFRDIANEPRVLAKLSTAISEISALANDRVAAHNR